MPTPEQTLRTYQELAAWHEQHGPPHVRDRFFILAADAAHSAGHDNEAEQLRRRLLDLNPHHMLRPFASFDEALGSPDVRNYVNDLRHSYPPDVAEELRRETCGENGPPEPPADPPLPPTIPVVDLDPLPRQPKPGAPDPVIVYWDKPEPQPTTPPRPKTPRRPTVARQPISSPPPAAPPRPTPAAGKLARLAAARRQTYPLPSDLEPPLPGIPPVHAEEDESRGRWVASVLFGLTFLLGAGLAVYTVARPFLPLPWLP